jgi:hypothetical protein
MLEEEKNEIGTKNSILGKVYFSYVFVLFFSNKHFMNNFFYNINLYYSVSF